MTEAIRQPHIGDFPKRKPGHQPAGAHPWRNQRPGEPAPASLADRFSQAPSPIVHHVRDGRPLTERGAELLKQRCDCHLHKQQVCDICQGNSGLDAWEWPQDVVVSPAGKPLHSKQTKQVHQYQQRKQV